MLLHHLDPLLFWMTADLERKLELFRNYYNAPRVHIKGYPGKHLGRKRAAQHLRRSGLRITAGKPAIAMGCLNCQSPRERGFAMNRSQTTSKSSIADSVTLQVRF
jgi:hypothetical protein